MFKKILTSILVIAVSLTAKEYTINLNGDIKKENLSLKIDLNTDEDGKPLKNQKVDIRELENFKSMKVLTASGLLGTLKDEREIIVFYKTDLNVGGLKIRNLYKPAVVRIYGEENNITATFDSDHYQNIVSFLRYHNVEQNVINDLDNMYGTWEEIDASQIAPIKEN
ncbi:MAG: hypothetical protein U9R37_00465 [Campylobacterota bacterium]|nr:hypothetical protein [Campylobacterota bacterium]